MSARPRWFAPVLATRLRRVALLITVTIGVLAAIGGLFNGDDSLLGVSRTVQSTMSITLPFLSVGLAHEAAGHRGERGSVDLKGTLATAVGMATVLALSGTALAAAMTALAGLTWGPWWETIATSVAVQVLASLVGTAFGFLVRRAWLACGLTVVAPLGAYLLLSLIGLEWMAPFGAFRAVFDPAHGGNRWARWAAMFALWGIVLNLVGWARASHHDTFEPRPSAGLSPHSIPPPGSVHGLCAGPGQPGARAEACCADDKLPKQRRE